MSTDVTDSGENLSTRQRQALPHLVASNTLAEGARKANISRTTIYRWMEDDEFRRELIRLRSEAAELAKSEMKGMMLDATMALREALDDEDPIVRLRAAATVLNLSTKTLYGMEVEKRINRLSDAVSLNKEKPW